MNNQGESDLPVKVKEIEIDLSADEVKPQEDRLSDL
jgi:hypothetical protein